MLTTVEAEIDVQGNIRLLEPLKFNKIRRAIVTVLADENEAVLRDGGAMNLLTLMNSPEFVNRKSYTNDEINAQIDEMRNSWE